MLFHFKRIAFILIIATGSGPLFGQVVLPKTTNIQRAYKKGTRSDDGRPGSRYWQNTANYHIKATFNPQNRELSGKVEIDYVNNSPDTLRELWFKLYPNLFKKGVARESIIQPEDETDGVKITAMQIAGAAQNVKHLAIRGTNLTVFNQMIMPGQTIHVSVTYNYTLNQKSHTRTGQIDGGSYFIAYFFPRIAVYDDIDGWNKYPYTGAQEFYNDFCHFNAEVTLPAGYLVAATGNLTNAQEIFNPTYLGRIKEAGRRDSVTDIITEADLKAGNVLKPGSHTWKFDADSVTDFVFATSNHYIWKAASLIVDPKTGRRTRVDAIFNPAHKSFFNVVNYARKTVEAMSYKFIKWPYPYPHETVFDGLDQMEYPMMVNDNPVEDAANDIELTSHEIFHTMFPFYMGINETKYAWMDEGWATIGEWLISPMIDPKIEDDYGIEAYAHSAGTEEDLPIMSLTTQQTGQAAFTDPYPKPAMGYLFVKDLLGDELFTKAMHYYISTWHGKHPQPFDFFNCINTGAGRNLNWFWKRWYFDGGVPDLGITGVVKKGDKYQVTITLVGTKPLPVDLKIDYADGDSSTVHRNVGCWEAGNNTILIDIDAHRKISKLSLGALHTPDANKANDVFTALP